MRIFVCKLRLHFPNSKHLRGLVCHDIFGNFFRHSEIFFQLHILTKGPEPNVIPHSNMYYQDSRAMHEARKLNVNYN